MKDRARLSRRRKNLRNDAAELDHSLAFHESRRKFRCVGIRNQYIAKRIQMDFSQRQKKLARLAEHDSCKYDGSVEVFPVSGAAFRDLLKGKKPMPGFPSKPYTGIPRLCQWLERAAFVYREEHLNSVLHGLQRLHDGMKSWSNSTSQGTVRFSRGDIEELLQSSHDKHRSVSASLEDSHDRDLLTQFGRNSTSPSPAVLIRSSVQVHSATRMKNFFPARMLRFRPPAAGSTSTQTTRT